MKGTRPLDNAEIRKVSDAFDGIFAVRNQSLFMLGVSVGGRISELLALKVNDVWQNGKPVKDLLFDRNIVKGGEISRAVPVNIDGERQLRILSLGRLNSMATSNLPVRCSPLGTGKARKR